jgi:putative spermidine/putrescine transport system ATP-binding protein
VAARVEDVIFEGDRVIYETAAPALGGARLRVIDHDPEGHAPHPRGAEVWLGWRRRDLILFAEG